VPEIDLKEGQYGSLCRVGLLLPSLNVVTEPEMSRLAPEGVSTHTTRLLLSGTMTPESYARMAEDAAAGAALLRTARVDVIAYACTSGSIVEDDAAITQTLEREGGVPAFTTAQAFIEALRALGLRRIAVGTPYVSFVNEAERKFLQNAGFEVTDIHGLEMGKTPESRIAIGRLKYDAVCDLARRVDSPEAEGVFLSCLNLATVGVLDQLEEELGKPVLSSTVATFWAALRRGGVETSIPGYGSFLREFPPLPADQASVSR
jgi:arylmalonate decarboxylase